jgi:hypothetical protein
MRLLSAPAAPTAPLVRPRRRRSDVNGASLATTCRVRACGISGRSERESSRTSASRSGSSTCRCMTAPQESRTGEDGQSDTPSAVASPAGALRCSVCARPRAQQPVANVTGRNDQRAGGGLASPVGQVGRAARSGCRGGAGMRFDLAPSAGSLSVPWCRSRHQERSRARRDNGAHRGVGRRRRCRG